MENPNSLSLPCPEPEIPLHETPSFRLAERSADYLSDTELLSLILNGTMSTTKSLGIAREMLAA